MLKFPDMNNQAGLISLLFGDFDFQAREGADSNRAIDRPEDRFL